MSAPGFFPPQPSPGSNAIGSFQIGVSPIGTISPFDWRATVISQYANSPVLLKLIENFAQYVDQTKNIDDFYDLIWNVDTAQGYGLDVWGRIVGVGRVLQLPEPDYFGFEETVTLQPFSQAPFFAGQNATSNYALPDDAYRVLIFAKALANISDGTIRSINQLLINLFEKPGQFDDPTFGFAEAGALPFNEAPFFGGGAVNNAYVSDDSNMRMRYVFGFRLTDIQRAIIEQSNVLPKSVGVLATVESPL